MKIDLDDGTIDIKDNNALVYISPNGIGNSSYFKINSSDGKSLINIQNNDYYLQSNNYPGSLNMSGSKLNLNNGSFEARSEQGRIFISGGENDTYFNISIPSNEDDITYTNPLFLLDTNNYYLKSADYEENEIIKDSSKTYNTYKQSTNSIVSITPIVAVSKDGRVFKTKGPIDEPVLDGEYTFNSVNIPIEGTWEGTDVITTVSQNPEQVRQTYLSQLTPNFKTKKATKGFKLDLKNSILSGYDLYLSGTNSSILDSSGNPIKFVFDSSNSSTPIKVGEKFSIGWDGTLTCNKLNSLNNDDNDNMAISISDNFYVTKSGGAGGSGVSFSGGFGGTFSGVGKFSYIHVTGEADISKLIVEQATFSSTPITLLSGVSDVQTDFVDVITSVSGSISRPTAGTAFSGSAIVDGVKGTSSVLVPASERVNGVNISTQSTQALSYVSIIFSTVTGHFLTAGLDSGTEYATAGGVG